MSWRLAKSLEVLRRQVDERYPGRSKASDGSIGDAKHKSSKSDHNPWVKDGRVGVVTAIDITHDLANGLDSEALAEALRQTRDPRIKYIISNRKICSSETSPWEWRPYTGKNPHDHHVHVSVKPDIGHFDHASQWAIAGAPTMSLADREAARAAAKPARPTLRLGDSGDAVKELQQILRIAVDGEFGKKTAAAVKARQKAARLVADGVVGPYTWAALTPKEP